MLFEETVLAGTKSLLHLQNSAVAGEKPRDHGEYRLRVPGSAGPYPLLCRLVVAPLPV